MSPEASTAVGNESHTRLTSLSAGVGFFALLFGVVALAFNNLGNRYFWTDESSSLYTSLGWPGVGDRAGSLGGAWDWTIETHVEPGLYNMLERFWALGIGTEVTTLRVYPFLFFLIYLGSLLAVGRLVRLPWFLIAGVVGLALLENITPYYTVELRPSSAGLAASVALPAMGLLLLQRPRGWTMTLFVVGFLFIGSMQYNSYPLEAALGVVLVGFGWVRYTEAKRAILVAAGILAVLWLPVVYVVSRGNPLSMNQEPSLEAISGLLIPNMASAEVLSLVQQNLLSPTALPRTVFLLAIPALWITRRWPGLRSPCSTTAGGVSFLWAFVLAATAVTAVIGFLGVMPWIVGTRWSIAEIGLIAVSLMGLAGVAVELGLLKRKPFLIATAVASLTVSLLAGYRLATYERFPGYDWTGVLSVMLAGTPGKTVVDTELYTDLRYWVELSGDYDEFRDDWVNHDVQTTSTFFAADASNVQEFVESANDRLLLGDAVLLEDAGVEIPESIDVIEVPLWGTHSGVTPPQPVLLVRGN